MYDSRTSIYDILREFIIEIIISQHLHSFYAAEITTELEKDFGFRVPEAVVRSVLHSLSKTVDWCSKQGQEYTVDCFPDETTSDIKQKYADRQAVNADVFKQLVKYINNVREKPLNRLEEKTAINSFCAFLLNEKNEEAYSEYISSFVLDHEDDDQFQSDLNEIREGVILYSGVTYNDSLLEVGHWKNEITLYLDQEILFHCNGFNGDLFKSYFDDFHRFVKEINVSGKKKLIHLRYFPETKDEIDAFFSYAERIVRGEGSMHPGNTAMKSIINGCQNASDVREKYTRFYQFLDTTSICLEENFVFAESRYPHNILCGEIYETIEQELGEKAVRSLPLLNKIHCLRGNTHSKDFYAVKYHFLTGTDATLKTAWHEIIKGSEVERWPQKTGPLVKVDI